MVKGNKHIEMLIYFIVFYTESKNISQQWQRRNKAQKPALYSRSFRGLRKDKLEKVPSAAEAALLKAGVLRAHLVTSGWMERGEMSHRWKNCQNGLRVRDRLRTATENIPCT